MKARLLLCVLWFSFTQAIAAVPDPAGPISATSSICVGSSGTYVTFSVAPINGATSYQWTPGGGPLTGIGDMTGSTFTVFIAPNYPTPNMNITVRGVNSSGTGLPAPLLTVPVYNSLPAAGPITGATVVNPGQTGVTYSISAVTGALNYIWTFPWGSNSTSTPSITLTFPSNFAGGQIRVYPQNGPCTATSSFIDVTIPTTTPGPAGNISGQTSVCAGSTYSYTVPSIPGATSYEWTPGGGPLAIIGSQTGNTINLQFAAGFDTGTATLVVRGKNGSVTGAPSPTLNITVYRP
jgi:large repetitive protein